MYFCVLTWKGGDIFKFGDVITAVASLTVISLLLVFVFLAVFVPVDSAWGLDVTNILSILVASLIVGYVFAVKIQEESRMGAVGRIAILSTVVMAFATMTSLAVNPYMSTYMDESLVSMFSISGWTAKDWLDYLHVVLMLIVALNCVFALVFSFIGLYAGSMLRKSKKR
jgi:hypothetical protein